MPVRNQSWYNSNESRDYPLDDKASAVADEGSRLPQNIVTDIRLRYPDYLGNYPFISAVSVTRSVVTITVQASQTADNGDNSLVPLAVLTVLLSELDEGRQYALAAQHPGVSGYVVFGSGCGVTYSGRFSSPAQTLITPRAARSYRSLPIRSMSKLFNATPLTGLVTLLGSSPIEVVKESREIFGVYQDAIVIRLVYDPTTTQAVEQVDTNVFQLMAGPCAKRPESRTCGDPQPIQYINSVAPDCDGVIELEFKGCALAGKNVDDCSVVIDCGLGLTESCLPPELPDQDGKLPSEYDPAVIPPPPDIEPEVPPVDSISESITVLGELPFIICFREQLVPDFTIVSGQFTFAEDYSPEQVCPDSSISASMSSEYSLATEGAASASQRNAIVWVGFDVTTLFRRVTTDLKLLAGPSGSKRNGGIIINYRPHATIAGRWVYYTAEINYDTQEFQIQRFNGTTFTPIVTVPVPGLLLESWYRISVEVVPGESLTQVAITTHLLGITDPSISITLGPLLVNNYLPAEGYFGLGSYRAQSRYSYFMVEAFDS